MATPRVPESDGAGLDLLCRETVAVHDLDMGSASTPARAVTRMPS